MELVITSWLAHQIIVRVERVFNVSVLTADIKAESSVKRANQKVWIVADMIHFKKQHHIF